MRFRPATNMIVARLDQIEQKLNRVIRLEQTEMADLTRITADVTANTDAVASAVSLLNELAAEIRAAGTDPAALDALATQIEQNSQALGDAVAANTTP